MSATLTFVSPPPGLGPHVEFALDDIEGAPGLHAMRAAHDTSVRLFLVEASMYIPDYLPSFSAENLDDVGVSSEDDTEVLVVATIDDEGPMVNLFAPVLVNPATGAAAQIILDGSDWPLRQRLERTEAKAS